MAADGALVAHEFIGASRFGELPGMWDNHVKTCPRDEGYRIYEGVCYSWHDFCERYPYIFAPLTERDLPKEPKRHDLGMA